MAKTTFGFALLFCALVSTTATWLQAKDSQKLMRREPKASKALKTPRESKPAHGSKPDFSGALNQVDEKIASEPKGKDEPAQGNEFIEWLKRRPAKTVDVLDVDGGRGDFYKTLRDIWPTGSFNYNCIGAHASLTNQCKKFDGADLPYEAGSKDLVLFQYAPSSDAEDAEDHSLGLLQDAARVSNGQVVVYENLGENSNHEHRWYGQLPHVPSKVHLKWADDKWENLFGLLGFQVDHSMQINKDVHPEALGHRVWVLTPKPRM